MKRTKIKGRSNAYSYSSPKGFGVIEFQGAIHPTGTDWFARTGFFQRKPSIGDTIKIKHDARMARWKRLGHFATLKLAEAAMRTALT